ncbi:MAG: metallophosphoesterase family protein [Desulfobacteraceae bacterium]|nr:metallophosphoesterase family protein [Desulfobacteraceae bacterium]MCB9495062.1 metallophosphoesterase family protein [Desulfobacteraceae bacterium]
MGDRIAIISDIHGNYEALKAVFEDMDLLNINDAVSLGDNIGYGPEPNQVVNELHLKEIPSVLGNHELGILNPEIKKWFNPFSREALNITENILTVNTKNLISQYPDNLIKNNILFVHGAPPDKILTYIFEFSPFGLKKLFSSFKETLCFTGHTHKLGIIALNDENIVKSYISDSNTIDKDKRYIINSGSVGQPRDGDKRAKYLIFNKKTYNLELRTVEYDRMSVKKKIIDLGFPHVFADML